MKPPTVKPLTIEIDNRFNAAAFAVGWRRRRVLTLGLPLWAVLGPQQRVALLGHELGHFVNGDIRRGLLTQLPLRTLGELANLLRPGPSLAGDSGLLVMVGDMLARARRPATVTLSETDDARIDDELAKRYARSAPELAASP